MDGVIDQSPRRPILNWPLAWPFVALLVLLLLGLIAAVQLGALTYAYQKLGLDQGWAFALLGASLLGSAVNIPIARLRAKRPMTEERVVTFLGTRYVVPPASSEETVVAVNVGGAVIPVALSFFLIVADRLSLSTLLAIAAVTVYVHFAARPVRGVGIAVNGLLPPLVAAGMALLIGGPNVPAVAYVSGTIGCLLGADLLNLGSLADLGAPVASIGGAGTFDGVFLTGIVAVLIASL
jgi:uncharacterized membrane protein